MSGTAQLLLAGLGGGGVFVAIVNWLAGRGTSKADEVATIVTASGEVVKLSSSLLATYVLEVGKLSERVARLEGQLAQRDRANQWLRSRVHQLEDYIREFCKFPVPHPVVDEEEPT